MYTCVWIMPLWMNKKLYRPCKHTENYKGMCGQPRTTFYKTKTTKNVTFLTYFIQVFVIVSVRVWNTKTVLRWICTYMYMCVKNWLQLYKVYMYMYKQSGYELVIAKMKCKMTILIKHELHVQHEKIRNMK